MWALFLSLKFVILRTRSTLTMRLLETAAFKKFIGLPSDKIFQAIKRVRKDDQKSLNAEAIFHAYDKGWINDWEKAFT